MVLGPPPLRRGRRWAEHGQNNGGTVEQVCRVACGSPRITVDSGWLERCRGGSGFERINGAQGRAKTRSLESLLAL